MNFPLYLTQDLDCFIHVTGHRIGLQDLVYYYSEGCSPEALLEAFPTLTLELIRKVIVFYLENQSDVDAYIATCDAEMERQRASALRGPDTVELCLRPGKSREPDRGAPLHSG